MQLSDEELSKLYEEYGGDLVAVAQRLNIDVPERPTYVPRRRTLTAPVDLGRPELRRYRVSAKHTSWSTWPVVDQDKIDDARAKYEAGTHEMCQGRDGDWFVLYLIPRKKRAGARKFFVTMEDTFGTR